LAGFNCDSVAHDATLAPLASPETSAETAGFGSAGTRRRTLARARQNFGQNNKHNVSRSGREFEAANQKIGDGACGSAVSMRRAKRKS
jgi:hypothetical protein